MLWLLVCWTSIATAESGFLMARARAVGPTTSLDGAVGGKASKSPTLPEKLHSLATSNIDVVPSNASAWHSSMPEFIPAAAVQLEQKAVSPPSVVEEEEEEPFEVHTMLLWASRAAVGSVEETHPDYHKRSDADHFGLEVTKQCVPTAVQAMWREAFTNAIELMMQKSLHGMQHGLLQVAHSIVQLVESSKCGLLASPGFDKLAEQAGRLQVLASAGSLNDLEVAVSYEPLKALTVGGQDIHLEINALIIAWRMNKGPEEMGRALAAFLRDFRDDSPSEAVSAPSQDGGLHESRTPGFWSEVLSTAMQRLGGGHELMSETCVSADAARGYGDAIADAIARMLEKTRQGMGSGIKEMAAATIAFVDSLQVPCSDATGAKHLRSAAFRLRVFASAKTLVDFAKHVEYEPMKVLKVGGIDIHKELNRFLVAWINHQGAAELAHGLVDLFEDFKEHEVPEEASATDVSNSSMLEEKVEADPEPEVLAILRDAIAATPNPWREPAREKILSEACLSDAMSVTFTDRVEQALEHMLQKRRRSMQLGLKELADCTDEIFSQMGRSESGCILSHDVEVMQEGARKLRTLTRKTVVDYGTHIKYEAMKGLTVGDVDIHRELNDFISTWKLKSRREAGTPFGALMRKLATIRGHDEL